MIISEKYTLQCRDIDGVWRDATSSAVLVSLDKARSEREILNNIFSERPEYYKVTGQRIIKITKEVVE